MPKLRLALIAGGKSAERNVSLNSGEQVYKALDKGKYDIRRYDPRDDLERLVRDAPGLDAALVIMHGRGGEDGTLQGLLDLLELPYQGSGVLASAMAMNKELSKNLYRQAGLKVSRAVVLSRGEPPDLKAIADNLGLPVVIKPVHEGSSIGIAKAGTLEKLASGLEAAFGHDYRVLVEEFLEGVEVTGGVLGNADLTALPLVEIIPSEQYDFFDYEAKYKQGASTEICPARLDEATTARAQEIALTAHRVLNCRGYSRTDMIVKGEDIYVLETNTIPGMTATSLFPQAARAYGLEFPQLLDRLIELALEKPR
jgi:D-alanine-D-alanine ligase